MFKTLFEIFTLSFGKLCQRIVLECMSHMEQDLFSSFNQSYHFFLGWCCRSCCCCGNSLLCPVWLLVEIQMALHRFSVYIVFFVMKLINEIIFV